MTPLTNDFSELSELIGKLADERLSDEDEVRLLGLLRDDPAARDYYLDYMEVHARLDWKLGKGELQRVQHGEEGVAKEGQAQCPQVVTPGPDFSLLLTGLSSPSTSFVGGMLFSYMIAAIVMGVGLLVASAWQHPDDAAFIAWRPGPSDAGHAGASVPDFRKNLEYVGRITGMVDCQWRSDECRMVDDKLRAKKDGIAPLGVYSPVALGDRFTLRSGLLEITYDTGAKVLLQGPVKYEVESKNGGFMSIGKLTGQANTRASRGLAIRTPTAVVTDLGTEFGVEVNAEGQTFSRVYRGSVELRTVSVKGGGRPGGSGAPCERVGKGGDWRQGSRGSRSGDSDRSGSQDDRFRS